MTNLDWIQPAEWPRPKGYSNGVVVTGGRLVVLAGQVGWDEQEKIVPGGLVPQFEQALKNVLTPGEPRRRQARAPGAAAHLPHRQAGVPEEPARGWARCTAATWASTSPA